MYNYVPWGSYMIPSQQLTGIHCESGYLYSLPPHLMDITQNHSNIPQASHYQGKEGQNRRASNLQRKHSSMSEKENIDPSNFFENFAMKQFLNGKEDFTPAKVCEKLNLLKGASLSKNTLFNSIAKATTTRISSGKGKEVIMTPSRPDLSFLLETAERRGRISGKGNQKCVSQSKVLRIGQFFSEENVAALSFQHSDSENYTIDFNDGQRECLSNDTDTDGSFQYWNQHPHLMRGNSEPVVHHSVVIPQPPSKKSQMHKRLKQKRLLRLNPYLETVYSEVNTQASESEDGSPSGDPIHSLINSLVCTGNVSILFND